jgi:hypothetical protein
MARHISIRIIKRQLRLLEQISFPVQLQGSYFANLPFYFFRLQKYFRGAINVMMQILSKHDYNQY